MELYLCQNPERAKIYSEHTRRDFEHRKIYFASTSIIFQIEITLEQTRIYSVCANRPLRSLTPPITLSLNISPSARSGLFSPLAQLGTHVTNVPQTTKQRAGGSTSWLAVCSPIGSLVILTRKKTKEIASDELDWMKRTCLKTNFGQYSLLLWLLSDVTELPC